MYLSINLSIYLSISYLSIYLSIYLSLYLFIYLASYLSIYLQIYLSLSISVSLSLSIYFSSYLYICLLIYLSTHLSLHLKVAMFNPGKLTSRTTFVVKSCDFRAPATKVDFAYYFRTKKSRFSSPSCESELCVLLSYLKVVIFKPRLRKWTLRTTFVLKSCDFQAPAAKVDFACYFRT